jgi:hypothetical protein
MHIIDVTLSSPGFANIFFPVTSFLPALCDGREVAYAGVELLLRKLFYLIEATSPALLIGRLGDFAGNLIIYRVAVF